MKVNSQLSKPLTISIEERKINRCKEQDKHESERYKNKKRAPNLITSQTDQRSKTVL